MSRLAERLRELRIYNNFELLNRFGDEKSVAIEYHAPPPGRLGWTQIQHTSVWSPRRTAGLEQQKVVSRVYEKQFLGKRSESYYAARNWASERYGHDYVPSPFGGLIPEHIKHKAERLAASGEGAA